MAPGVSSMSLWLMESRDSLWLLEMSLDYLIREEALILNKFFNLKDKAFRKTNIFSISNGSSPPPAFTPEYNNFTYQNPTPIVSEIATRENFVN